MAKQTDLRRGQPGEPGEKGSQPTTPGAGAGGRGGRGGEGGAAGFENRSRSETRTNRILGFLAVTVLAIMLMFVNNRTERALDRLGTAITEARDAAKAAQEAADNTADSAYNQRVLIRRVVQLQKTLEEAGVPIPPSEFTITASGQVVPVGKNSTPPGSPPAPPPNAPPQQDPDPSPGNPPHQPPGQPPGPPGLPPGPPPKTCIDTPVGKVCVP